VGARILIVDDHPLVRTGLASLIEGEPDLEICGQAGSLMEALELAHTSSPDLAIVDLSIPDGSGLELLKRLTTQHPAIKVLICSMHDEMLFAERALAAGAKGYVSKQEATAHIIEAIRQVLRGRLYLSEEMTQRLIQGAVHGEATAGATPLASLSNRELEVFEMIGRGLGTSEIANRLHLSVKTIETHREKVKRKLSLVSSSALVRYAIRWVLEQG